MTPYGRGCLKDSRLTFTRVNSISSVIVLVDLDDTKEIKLGPLTDYVSMVGLTDVDLDGNWGDEPTILRLFAASGDAASQKMSIWDRAFLQALYATSMRIAISGPKLHVTWCATSWGDDRLKSPRFVDTVDIHRRGIFAYDRRVLNPARAPAGTSRSTSSG